METDKARILRTGDYGYAHVWELQHLRPGQEAHNDLDLTAGHKEAVIMPAHTQPEFGAHLLKCPKSSTFRSGDHHPYESPRFLAMDPATGQYHTGTVPCYHHFNHDGSQQPTVRQDQVHSGTGTEPRRASVADTIDRPLDESEEARYTN